MRTQDKVKFAELLAGVMAVHSKNVTQMLLDIWWNAMQRYDLDQVREAFNQQTMDPDSGQFCPKPADIVKQLQGTHGDRAMLAWGKVFDAIGCVGPHRSVQFDDAAIHACIDDLGGWIQICKITMDELPFLQKRFCDTYRAYSRRPRHEYPKTLIGLSDLQNASSKVPIEPPPPTLIGDPETARQVALLATGGRKHAVITLGKLLQEQAKLNEGAQV